MGEKIEALKHHSCFQSHLLQRDFLVRRQIRSLAVFPLDAQIANADQAAVEHLEKIDAPQERRFAAAGRAHDDGELTAREFQREVLEKSVVPERFRYGFDLDHRPALALLMRTLCWLSFALKPIA